jgi:hypothetical protein
MAVQLLPRREAIDSSEVCLHQHLCHGQGNPGAMTDTTLNGIEDTAVRVLEALLPGAWRDPQEVKERVHRRVKTL